MEKAGVLAILLYALASISVAIAGVVLLNSSNEPACGNKLMERGENPQTCCEDAGCLPTQSCTNHSCTDIKCGNCEYIAGNSCQKYECCSDAECGKNETCSRNTNKCVQIECDCGYIKNRACVNYECCSNNECPSETCQNNRCAPLAEPEQPKKAEKKTSKGGSPAAQQQEKQQETPATPITRQGQQAQLQCTPALEICDGKDNNCNGLADDGIACECTPGQTKSCGGNSIGQCRMGTQACQSDYKWGSCEGKVDPAAESCDNKDNNCNGQIDEGSLCPGGQLCSGGNCKDIDSEYAVQPVIFYSKDYSNDNEMVNYLKEEFEEIRQFYNAKAGVTFTMLQTAVVYGDYDHEWYWCVDSQGGCEPNNFEANIIKELKNKGLPIDGDWNKVPADKVTWVAAFGAGGWAGGRSYPTGGGFAMVGDAGIYAAKDKNCNRVLDKYFSTDKHPNIKDSCQNSWIPSGKAEGFGIGALGHELGHALTLPHPDGYPGTTLQDWEKTLMGYHWNYPDTGLLEQDISIILQSKYFNTKN
ncbi:hypothetical protein HYU17_01190 [Candidatus Woesearchaeota archaeon]|nr:hypothetical protein [Candidatus Woesearchaeota archaeon]